MLDRSILQINNLSKNFGNKNILDNVTYKFYPNNLYGIIGESGSGKTTLLNILGLIDNKYDGEIIFRNELLKSNFDYYNLRANNIGFIFQSYYLIDEISVKDNILLPLKYTNRNFDNEYFDFLVKKMKIEKIINEKTNYLSGGEKQRVAIARALINNPDLIICDEPTGNLDNNNANSVMDILKSFLNENRTIILVTHSNEIANQCTKLILLKGGKLYEMEN